MKRKYETPQSEELEMMTKSGIFAGSNVIDVPTGGGTDKPFDTQGKRWSDVTNW